MASKLKKLKDLERKLTVSVPVEDYESKYSAKLTKIKSSAKLDGFRKGNVPDDVLKQRYGDSIHYEVLNELIQESYPKELQAQELKPASSPAIDILDEDASKPVSYSAVFEVFPEVKPKLSRWTSYEKTEITLDDADIDLACVTGKPPEKGGLVGRSEATGRGVQYIIKEFFRHQEDFEAAGFKGGLKGKKIAVQGLGNVGYHAAKFLHEEDECKIVCIMEHNGAILNSEGLNVEAAKIYQIEHGTFEGFDGGSFDKNSSEMLCM